MPPALIPAVDWCRNLRRAARVNGALATTYGVVQILMVGAVLAAVATDATHAAATVRVVTSVVLGALLLGFILVAWRTARATGDLVDVAIEVERRSPSFRSSLVTAVEIADGRTPAPTGETWIVERLASQVADGVEASRGVDFTNAQRRRAASRWLLWTLVGAAAGYALHGDAIRAGLRSLATLEQVEPQPSTPVRVAAVVHDVEVNSVPPSYTGLPSHEGAAFSGKIHVLRGTAVALRGRLAFPDATRLWVQLPTADGGHERKAVAIDRGRFELDVLATATGTFHFEAQRRGRLHVQQRPHVLEIKPDEAPTVRILFPAEDQEVRLDDEVRLMFEARDDFGVAAIRRVVRIAGPAMERMRPVGTPETKRSFSGRDTVTFSDLGARPGDTVEISYEAEDTDTLSGPKTARSAPRRFKIFSAEEKHARVLDKEGELLELMLTRLADRLVHERALDTDVLARQTHAAYLGLVADDATHLAFFDGLMRDVDDDAHTTEIVRASLREMLSRQRALHERDAADSRGLDPAQRRNPWAVKKATALHPKIIDTFESDVLAIDDLIMQQRQDRLASDAAELQRMEEQLRKLLSTMREGATDAQMRQAFDALDRLEERLRQMREEMKRMAKNVPYENFNPDALLRNTSKMSLSDVDAQLKDIRELLAQGKMEEALKRAEALERDIQQLAAQMREGLVRPRNGGGGRLARQMQQAAQNLDDLAREQHSLNDETTKLEDQERRALEERFQQGFNEEIDHARQEVAEIRERMKSIRPNDLHPYDREALERARADLDNLDQRLENHDVPRAAEQARKLGEEVDRLSMEIKLSSRRERRHKRRRTMGRAAGKCRNASQKLGGLAERLESMMPEPSESLGERGTRRSRELERRQRGLRQKLRGTQEKLQEVGEGFPALERLMKGMLEGAGTMMERAGERLGQSQPKRARPHQDDALERLKQASKQIRDSMKPGGQQGSQDGVGHDRENPTVEIPGAEDYQAPRAFRDLLMRTMKERSPGRFDQALDRYFKELAR